MCKGPAEQSRLVGMETASRPVQTEERVAAGAERGRLGRSLGRVGPGEDFLFNLREAKSCRVAGGQLGSD